MLYFLVSKGDLVFWCPRTPPSSLYFTATFLQMVIHGPQKGSASPKAIWLVKRRGNTTIQVLPTMNSNLIFIPLDLSLFSFKTLWSLGPFGGKKMPQTTQAASNSTDKLGKGTQKKKPNPAYHRSHPGHLLGLHCQLSWKLLSLLY